MKLLVFIFLLMVSCYANNNTGTSTEITGKIIKIVDGDTYDILLNDQTTKRVRMEGIDAPEKGMRFYKAAKDYLGKLCFGNVVRVEQTNKDRYGRIVAKTFITDNQELGLLMVEAGLAWHFKEYSSDQQLANAEIEARNKKTGLWVDKMPIAPWQWRKSKKEFNKISRD